MKLHQALVLGAMAMALAACGDDEDKKDKPDTPPKPAPEKTVKYDGAVPENLAEQVKKANTVDKVDLLAKVKPGEAVGIKLGQHDVSLVGGKWATATIHPDEAKFQGLGTAKEDIAKLESKKAMYKGVAVEIRGKQKGALKYDVDFASKKGKGEITGMTEVDGVKNISKIVLNETTLDVNSGVGKAVFEFARPGAKSAEMKKDPTKADASPKKDAEMPKSPDLDYSVAVFGPQANEVAGAVTKSKSPQLVFHGVRQEDKIPAGK